MVRQYSDRVIQSQTAIFEFSPTLSADRVGQLIRAIYIYRIPRFARWNVVTLCILISKVYVSILQY